jgi:meso-butanediol dehydrogenase/(S,S)-butanediol dehydrogenase/diacetyl reductase
MRLKDRVTIVTGAGTGIGRATAERFAEEGALVALVGRRKEKLEEAAKAIGSSGGRFRVTPADVSEPGAMQRVVDALLSECGRIDCLVANAGVVVAREAALETTEEDWNTTLAVNLTGVHRSCLAVLPAMIAQASGVIVTMSSISGQIAVPKRASYAASKAGVIGYTRNLAVDYGRNGIRANCLCPAFVETDINRDALEAIKKDESSWQAFVERHPIGLGTPRDVANAALFLCSDEARWITGVDLSVDGGYTAL